MAWGLELKLCGLDCLPWPSNELLGEQVSVIRRFLPLGDYLRVLVQNSDGCSPCGGVGLVANVMVGALVLLRETLWA